MLPPFRADFRYVMSLHRLSAGSGFRYLLRHTATGDAPSATGLSGYYQASGNPPGRWLGAGLAGLANGEGLAAGTVVTEPAMSAVFGAAVDPLSGRLLGRGMPRNGVAGFDLTFTVPKSVSVLWALGDSAVRQAVETAHHAAVGDALAHIEARALTTRTGHGGAVSMRTRGAVAAAFDHYDSRAHDPHLHTHLVLANRVQGMDGHWRAVDARPCTPGRSRSPSCTTACSPTTSPRPYRSGSRGASADPAAPPPSRPATVGPRPGSRRSGCVSRQPWPPGQATTVHPLTQLRAEWTQRVAASGRTPTGVSDEALANSPAASTTR